MKKGFFVITISLILVMICSTYALAESTLGLGYSFKEKLTAKTDDGNETTSEVDRGVDFSLEVTTEGTGIESGFGITCQRLRSVDLDDNSLKFQFIPVYGIFALEVSETETNNVYLLGKLGLDYLLISDLPDSASTRIGYYYAIGFGMKIGPYLRTQALYEVNNGTIKDGGTDTELFDKKYTLKCGYAF